MSYQRMKNIRVALKQFSAERSYAQSELYVLANRRGLPAGEFFSKKDGWLQFYKGLLRLDLTLLRLELSRATILVKNNARLFLQF